MRVRLRWKILLFTALAPVALAVGTLWTVNRSVSGHLEESINESLRRSSRVFENMLTARTAALEVAAQVIVRDPRFFSILMLPASPADPEYRATVAGVAREFHVITGSDLFEVLDRQGRIIASVGPGTSSDRGRAPLVREALAHGGRSGILVEHDRHYQATVTPVVVGGHTVGALVLGAEIGGVLASRLRTLTHSEVTFVSGRTITGSTLSDDADRRALLVAVPRFASGARPAGEDSIFEVKGAGTYLTLARGLAGSGARGGQYYVMQRSLDAETAFVRDIQFVMLELGIVAILAALAMGFWVSERITRPVQHLVRGAEEMEQGNYDFPLDVHGQDEIGYLADRFRVMRQREKNYVAELQQVARQKSEFIAIASHELRTPISVINGFVELFAQGTLGPTTPQQQSAMAAIERSVQHLTRIAEDATRVAQIEGGRLTLRLEEFEVEALIADAIDEAVQDAPNRTVHLTHEVADHLGPVRVDGARLTQAVANLVRNGIRFTPDGGTVSVRVWGEGGVLVIEVRDNGIGIAADRLADIFQRSFSAGDSMHHHSSTVLEFNSAGLGLGLATTRGIVEAHGGTVEAASREGQGSIFLIRVPCRAGTRLDQAA